MTIATPYDKVRIESTHLLSGSVVVAWPSARRRPAPREPVTQETDELQAKPLRRGVTARRITRSGELAPVGDDESADPTESAGTRTDTPLLLAREHREKITLWVAAVGVLAVLAAGPTQFDLAPRPLVGLAVLILGGVPLATLAVTSQRPPTILYRGGFRRRSNRSKRAQRICAVLLNRSQPQGRRLEIGPAVSRGGPRPAPGAGPPAPGRPGCTGRSVAPDHVTNRPE